MVNAGRLGRRSPPYALGAVCLVVIAAGASVAAATGTTNLHQVSQMGRAFRPTTLDIRGGDAVEFVNDDGELLHHAYLESETFSFDTGDQEPGSRAVITFPKRGTFQVLCGIHPRMKLVVRVQ